MNEEEVNTMANELVEELIVFNKIKMNVKNIWATKLIDFFLSEKQDYNLYQHSKVMKKIPKVPADGIQALLELIKQQNNQMETKMIAQHTEAPKWMLNLWTEEELRWARDLYYGDQAVKIRERYVTIHQFLELERPGKKRSALVDEVSKLERGDYSSLGN